MRAMLVVALAVAGFSARAETINKELKAGGEFHYVTQFDRITVTCTAKPQTPTIVSRACTCVAYDAKPWTGMMKYRLSESILLSDGTSQTRALADYLDSLATCKDQLNGQFSAICEPK